MKYLFNVSSKLLPDGWYIGEVPLLIIRFSQAIIAVIAVIQAIADAINFIDVNWADVVIVVVAADIIHVNFIYRDWIGTLFFTFWFPLRLTNLMFFLLRFSKDWIGTLILLSFWFCLTLTKLMLFILVIHFWIIVLERDDYTFHLVNGFMALRFVGLLSK